jgi:hypothetical protein
MTSGIGLTCPTAADGSMRRIAARTSPATAAGSPPRTRSMSGKLDAPSSLCR